MSEKRVTGPIQVFVIGFEKFNETGMILAELRRVRKRGVIRVVDLLFVQKDKRGNVSNAMHMTDLSEDERLRLGAVAGGLIGLQAGGLEGAAATIMNEAMFHGVRCGLIHPGYTDTPMVRALGEDYIGKNILPYTQLGRLIRPEEIADAICFMLANSAVSGELWVDAGWHAPA